MSKNLFHKYRGALAATALAGFVAPLVFAMPVEAVADVGPNPNMEVIVEKTFDGTGHGTEDATFVNTANGFVPGDDNATDGVVSTNDVVGYDVTLRINAGQARTVSVSLEGSDFLTWESGKESFCAPLPGIATNLVGDSCDFTIDQGATAQITRTVLMTALDTSGLAEAGQTLSVSSGIKGEAAFATSASAPVTVVSAPLADLVAHGASTYSWSDTAGEGAGSFLIEARTLWPENFSKTKGVTAGGTWQATVDVSDFPEGTTWKLGEDVVTVSDGKIEISGTGNQALSFEMPGGVWPAQDEGATHWYSIGLTVPATAFSTANYLNNGDGWQPGTGVSRETSTLDTNIGSIGGYLYPNNDHTAVRVHRSFTPSGAVFSQSIEVPYSPSESIFDDGNLFWDDAVSSQLSFINGSSRERGVPAQFNIVSSLNTETVTESGTAVVGAIWDTTQTNAIGTVTVIGSDGNPVDPALFDVQWSTDATADDSLSDPSSTGWVLATGPLPVTANAVRVVFNDGVITPNSGIYTVQVPMQVRTDFDETLNPVVASQLFGRIAETTGSSSAELIVVFPQTPTLTLDLTVDKTGVTGGEVLKYSATPRVADPATLKNGFPAKVTVVLDRCQVEPQNASSSWAMTVEPAVAGPSGRVCGDIGSTPAVLTFTPINAENIAHASWASNSRIATLPQIAYTARVALPASNDVSVSASFSLSKPENVVDANASLITPVTAQSVSAGSISAKETHVEANKPMTWNVSLIQQGSGDEVSTVIALPQNGESHLTDPSYTGATKSNFSGAYTLSSVSTNGDDTSVGIELWFTTNTEVDLTNVSSNTWHKVSEASTGGIPALADATGLKIVGTGSDLLTTSLTVELTPSNNSKDDVYLMWLGATVDENNNELRAASEPSQITIVTSTVKGSIWWDENNSGSKQPLEPGIEDVELGLFAVEDGKMGSTPVAVTSTDANGAYEFDSVSRGTYQVSIVGRGGSFPEYLTSYYGQDIPVESTFSFKDQYFARSSITSTVFTLVAGGSQPGVDFGFFQPKPLVDVDKEQADVNCDSNGVCDVSWNVHIKNLGNAPINAGTFTDTVSNNLYAPEAFFGEFQPGTRIVEIIPRYSDANTQVGAFAIDETGGLYSWGNGLSGSNGNNIPTGSGRDNPIAKPVIGLENIELEKVVDRSGEGGYALSKDGKVYSWGSGGSGANGNGSSAINYTAQLVEGLPGNDPVIDIIARAQSGGYALTTSGLVYSWGAGEYYANGDGTTDANFEASPVLTSSATPLTEVARIIDRSGNGGYAITQDQHVYAWGYDNSNHGANGNGFGTNANYAQKVLVHLNGTALANVTDVVARGTSGAFALDSDGKVYSWGSGADGANGNASVNDNLIARQVQGLPEDDKASEVLSRGTGGGLVLTESGNVYSWGVGANGANGIGSTINTNQAAQVNGVSNVKKVVARGSAGGFALTTSGEVYSWGKGASGANGNLGVSDNTTAKRVGFSPTLSDTIDIFSRGEVGGFALTDKGTVFAWGQGTAGSLGDGNTDGNYAGYPVEVLGLEGTNVESVFSLGSTGGYAVTDKGAGYAWGAGKYYANANGTEDNNYKAMPIQGFRQDSYSPGGIVPTVDSRNVDQFVEREYAVPLVPAGETLDIIFRGKVNASSLVDTYLANQAWFTAPSTPISGILPYGKNRPDLPVVPDSGTFNAAGIPGNDTCDTDVDDQNSTTPDSCDQVPAKVSAQGNSGSVSGLAWLDSNEDGVKDLGELPIEGMTVNLFQNSAIRGTATTDADGKYVFPATPAGSGYTVSFDMAGTTPTPDQLEKFGLSKGSFGPTSVTNPFSEYGSSVVPGTFASEPFEVTASTETKWVNAGLVIADAVLSVTKGTSDTGTDLTVDPVTGEAALVVDVNGDAREITVDLSFKNEGTEALTGFAWTDQTLEGPKLARADDADQSSLSCEVDGVSVDVPTLTLDKGKEVKCTDTLSGLSLTEPRHSDRFTVTARGATTSTPVQGSADFTVVAGGTPSWSLEKTSDPVSGTYVNPGDVIEYTLTATNTGDLTLTGLEVFDNMSKVLNNSAIDGILPADTTQDGADLLVWAVPDLQPGNSISITYSVKVNDDAWKVTLENSVTGSDTVVSPTSCDSANPCTTEHHTPFWVGALPLPVLGNVAFLAFIAAGLAVVGGGAVVTLTRRRKSASMAEEI